MQPTTEYDQISGGKFKTKSKLQLALLILDGCIPETRLN